ncbi:MAG TPA: SDR family oxidoreductase [Acidimicrobiales bacterium]|nr:SDR family oxidoreductase [Acidimicrobiales bacterium]
MRIQGARILVTGASSGIGEALAPMLAERGATVGVVARRRPRLEQTLARCREHVPDSAMWVADLSDIDSALRVVDEAWESFGRLDCLINNAAIGKRKHLLEHSTEDLELVMRTNFTSPVRMCLSVLPRMLEQGSGAIVNVASGGGRFGIVHESAYCASKFALSGWTEVAAMELAGTPVEVKLIQPGAVETEIWIPQPGELPGLPGAQFISPSECAAGIVEALEADGFEFFVPADLKEHVEFKNRDIGSWIQMMANLGKAKEPSPG